MTRQGEIYARIGGAGPPLLLLHGYPQTHVAWHLVAPHLARHFTVVLPDLRGHGFSACLPTDIDHRPYSKREMAREMVEVMGLLGFGYFAVMGHDRGARVAYRMALDSPAVVERLVLIDILPTLEMWASMQQAGPGQLAHWSFLAQPAPIPESLIASDPANWVDGRLKRASRDHTLDAFDADALAQYRRAMTDPDHVHATCEDYRAGARIDIDDDRIDLDNGHRIACRTLLVFGTDGQLAHLDKREQYWHRWCHELTSVVVESGHWIPEENPRSLVMHALPFLLSR